MTGRSADLPVAVGAETGAPHRRSIGSIRVTRGAAIAVGILMSCAVPAFAEPKTHVFPLSASNLPDNLALAPSKMTKALAQSINATVAKVPIEDAAGLLECDPESTTCLTSVAKSVNNAERLVFGTVAFDGGKVKVTLTRFEPKPDRQQQTFELTGKTADALASELVRVSGPLFGKATKPGNDVVITDDPKPDVPTKPEEPTTPKPATVPGKITTSTWGIIGGGAVAVGAGIVMLVSAQSIKRDVENAPNESLEDLRRLKALEDRGIQRTRIGDVLVVAGGVAMAAGIVRAVIQRSRSSESAPTPTPDPIALVPIEGGAAVVFTVIR
jgi:hypothetical protein